MYKEPADIMGFIVISFFVVFCLFIVLVFFLSDNETKGALYLNKDGKSDFICDGVLYERIGYVTKYDFVCSDGREIYNLTNFTMKKEADK
jgi:hypothetical protein